VLSSLQSHGFVAECQTHVHYARQQLLQHAATHCNTLQYTATHCNTLQHTAVHCNTLQHTATHCNTLQYTATHCNTLQHTAVHCNTLQHTSTHCNTLQHTRTFHRHSRVDLLEKGSSFSCTMRTTTHVAVCCSVLQ